jgi:ribosomal protein L16 Arg81 hydroxylase
MADEIDSLEKLKSLEYHAIQTIEAFITNNSLPIEQRAILASQILGLMQNPQASTSKIEPELSASWKKWIIENKLLHVPDESLIETMVKNGIDIQIAIQAINSINADSSFQLETNNLQLLKKLESIFEVKRKVAELSPNFGAIARVSRLSREEFIEKYYATNTPVIITNMMDDWPAMSLWCPDYLKTKYGHCPVEIQGDRNSDSNYEINSFQHKKTVKLSEYVDIVVNSGETNDYYMVANNGNLEREDLKSLLNDINMLPEFLDATNTKQRVFFWFGPAGTITPLHHDPMNIMMAHVYGRKRWRFIAPDSTPLLYNYIGVFSEVDLENIDYDQYPLFKDVKIIETVLEPGEIIFIPVGWWHQVKGLDVTIALSFTNFIFPNEYNYKNPHITSVKQENNQNQVQNQGTKITEVTSDALTNEIVENTKESYLVDQIFTGETLIISFGFVAWDSQPQFDFYGRTKKIEKIAQKPINRILVRDISNSWYHRGIAGLGTNVDEVCASLQEIIKKISPSKIITIGQSMGAYAAIMFGQLLGADQVIAFGSLSFLNTHYAKEIGDTRWLSIMENLEANPPDVCYFDLVKLCQDSNHTPDIHIFYGKKPDPETIGEVNLDDFHAKRMNELSNCTIHPYDESGHAIVKYLIDNKLIDSLLLETIFAMKMPDDIQEESQPIPAVWKNWITENIARGVPKDQIIAILQANGFSNPDI